MPLLEGSYGVLLHEAQMLDSRMNLHALFTAAQDSFIPGMKGATLANYVEVQGLLKAADGRIEGAHLLDRIKGRQFKVKAKAVVNCAGVHADALRKMDDPKVEERIIGAKGTHLIFK